MMMSSQSPDEQWEDEIGENLVIDYDCRSNDELADISAGSSTGTSGDDVENTAQNKSRDLPVVGSSGNGVTSNESQRQLGNDNEQQRARLQLGAYCNSGLLTLHIMKVQLHGQQGGEAVYVKVALQPDVTKRTVCKTDVMTSSPNGCIEFNAKFSYELLEEDFDKQIVITAWKRSSNKLPSRGLGLIALDVSTVCQQQSSTQSTWFPFKDLPSDVGIAMAGAELEKKKARCVEAEHDRRTHRIQRSASVTSGTDNVPTMETKLILIYRGRNGFGFSISGENPVVVCRVDDGSMAQIAGLNLDDRVLRVDGRNVARANSEHVAALVRKASHKIVFEIQRPIHWAAPSLAGPQTVSSTHQLKRPRNSTGAVPQPPSARQQMHTRDHQRGQPVIASHINTDVDDWHAQQSGRQLMVAPPPDRVPKPLGHQLPFPGSGTWQDNGKGQTAGRSEHPVVRTVDYGWLGPVDDDDDTDGSDKENMPTFPLGFRPVPGRHQRIQPVSQHDALSGNSSTVVPQRKPSSGNAGDFQGRWCDPVPEFDHNGRNFERMLAQQGHVVDFRNNARVAAPMQERRLGTIHEVTELSDCSAATLKPRRGRSSDAGSEADFESRVSKSNNENFYMNANDVRKFNNHQSIAAKTRTDRAPVVHETQVKPSWSSPDSRNYDEDDLSDRLSTVSTADTSVTVDRQQYCTGVLTFRSGKKRFGLVDLYRQKRQSMKRKICQEPATVGERFGGDDAAERISIASGCSSVTSDAPSMKRQRLPSFKKIVRMGIDKLRRF